MHIYGIKTHNLKNLEFVSHNPEIIGICGVSGGGKSSFAYHTIYSLCASTFYSIENGFIGDNDYIVDNYSNLLPSVAMKQINCNTNPRSTIYSYLNFPSILSSLHTINYELLKLNKPTNECPHCKGSGYEQYLDLNRIILPGNKIIDGIFKPWQPEVLGNNSLNLLLIEFCKYKDISIEKRFDELSNIERDLLLNYRENNSKVFEIAYKKNSRYKKSHLSYQGIIPYLEYFLNSNKVSNYKKTTDYRVNKICQFCDGTRINKDKYKDIFVYGIPFKSFLSLSIEDILSKINISNNDNSRLYALLNNCYKLGIGYLSLNRSIPTLSGGELQKLNFANLICSDISNILIVIDEISSGLHVNDIEIIKNYITNLKRNNNTVILIEHNKDLLKFCDRIICLGPVGGKKGGYIVTYNNDNFNYPKIIENKDTHDFLNINNINKNNIKDQKIKLMLNTVTAIIGKSGSGKSSLGKYLEDNLDNCIYISQKSLRGNIKSSVATYLEINKPIAEFFAKHFNKDIDFFSINGESEILCSNCNGTGIIKYERGFESTVSIVCPECNGNMFNNKADNFKINDVSIKSIYEDELCNIFNFPIRRLQNIIDLSKQLSIDHLSLNRKIGTLSGGELKRIKILKHLLINLKNKIFIIDEPSAGLDLKNSIQVLNLLKRIKTLATIIIEHNPHIYLLADNIIKIGPDSGKNGGKIIFNDTTYKYMLLEKIY